MVSVENLRAEEHQFGPYSLKQTIGQGEFGKVKLAVHAQTKVKVAIKFIKKQNVNSTQRMEKLSREVSILQALSHKYIIKLFEVIETPKHIGLVLEYAPGGELFEYILAREYLAENEAKRLFVQIVDCLAYLHSVGVVHRDLKLENILMDVDRNIKITDFGFANFVKRSDGMLSTSCGSPCYAAPELVTSTEYIGEIADMWSLGVILYAMLCGTLPFDDDPENEGSENMQQLYKYIMETVLTFPIPLTGKAMDLCMILLETDPKKRAGMKEVKEHFWLMSYKDTFTDYEKVKSLPLVVSRSLPVDVPANFTSRANYDEIVLPDRIDEDLSGVMSEVDVAKLKVVKQDQFGVDSEKVIMGGRPMTPIPNYVHADTSLSAESIEDFHADNTRGSVTPTQELVEVKVEIIHHVDLALQIVEQAESLVSVPRTDIFDDLSEEQPLAKIVEPMRIDTSIAENSLESFEDDDEVAEIQSPMTPLHPASFRYGSSPISTALPILLPNAINATKRLKTAGSIVSMSSSASRLNRKSVTSFKESLRNKSFGFLQDISRTNTVDSSISISFASLVGDLPITVPVSNLKGDADLDMIDDDSSNNTIKLVRDYDEDEENDVVPGLDSTPFGKVVRIIDHPRPSLNLPYHARSSMVFHEQARQVKSLDLLRLKSSSSSPRASVLKYVNPHSGPIDQRAVTEIPPAILLERIMSVLIDMGLNYTFSEDPYKLMVIKSPMSLDTSDNERISDLPSPKSDSSRPSMSFDFNRRRNSHSQHSNASSKKASNGGVLPLGLGSSINSVFQKIRYISLFGWQYNRGYDGSSFIPPLMNKNRPPENEFVKFHVVVHRIHNLKDLFIVDLKRHKGSIWEFKRIYSEIIKRLELTETRH